MKKETKKETKKNICVICKSEVKPKEEYFKVDLFNEGKLKGTDYCHKKCKDNQNLLDISKLDINKLIEGFMPMIK